MKPQWFEVLPSNVSSPPKVAVTTSCVPGVADGGATHDAVSDASSTAFPPAHCSDSPDGPETANVTVPVGVPAVTG